MTSQPTKTLIALAMMAAIYGTPAVAQDFKLSDATIEPERRLITITGSGPLSDTLAKALEEEGHNWTITLYGTTIAPEGKPVVDVRRKSVQLRYLPGSIKIIDAAEIRENALRVEFKDLLVVVKTGKAAHYEPKPQGLFHCFDVKPTKLKKQADIDVSGGMQGGAGTTPQYFWTASASCPYSIGRLQLGPAFKGEASAQRNADPDTMKVGMSYRWQKPKSANSPDSWLITGDLPAYEFERKVKTDPVIVNGAIAKPQVLEKNTNLIWSGKASYVYAPVKQPVEVRLGFAGIESGSTLSRTIKKDSNTAVGQSIMRAVFDAEVYYTDIQRDKPTFVFHGSHVVRLPFEQEPYTEAGVNGGKLLLTNKPRHLSVAEILLPIRDGTAISLKYKRGSAPPTFVFVDHQFTIGFNLLLKN